MKASEIEALSIYPEHRLAYHPPTAKIFDRFHDTSTYQVTSHGRVIEQYRDELTDVQKKILTLLSMSEEDYWHGIV